MPPVRSAPRRFLGVPAGRFPIDRERALPACMVRHSAEPNQPARLLLPGTHRFDAEAAGVGRDASLRRPTKEGPAGAPTSTREGAYAPRKKIAPPGGAPLPLSHRFDAEAAGVGRDASLRRPTRDGGCCPHQKWGTYGDVPPPGTAAAPVPVGTARRGVRREMGGAARTKSGAPTAMCPYRALLRHLFR